MVKQKRIATHVPPLHKFSAEKVDQWLREFRDGSVLFLDDIPQPGQDIALCGAYEVQTVIRAGGCSVVYTAWSTIWHRKVALKLFRPGESRDVEAALRFQHEAAIGSSVQHPNIVRVTEVGEHEGRNFYSMDLILGEDGSPGRTLEDLARNGPLAVGQAVKYVKAMAEAAQYLHEQGIVHRDMTPMNVVVDSGNQPHLIDFGVACRLDQDLRNSCPNVVGTPGYLPPEQACSGKIPPTPPSDVYGIGAILYRLLTGRPPCLGRGLSDTIRRTLEEGPIPVRVLNQSVSAFVEAICLKCLRKDARERYCSTASLAEDLEHALQSEQQFI